MLALAGSIRLCIASSQAAAFRAFPSPGMTYSRVRISGDIHVDSFAISGMLAHFQPQG